MPIYEYYCSPCHTIYSFFARRSISEKKPICPKCGHKNLERKMSRFAISRGLRDEEPSAEDPFANVDESRMEQVMSTMEREFESVDESNPKQMAQLMRRMFQAVGVEPQGGMLEAMSRMEAGEDPDRIDEELGETLDGDDPLSFLGPGTAKQRIRRLIDPPIVDPELYDFETDN